MSEKNTLSILNLSEQTSELLNEFDNVHLWGLTKEKENEIKRLLVSVKWKHKKYNAIRHFENVSIKKELSETYALNTDCHVYTPETNVLFGLNEIDISNRKSPIEKFPFLHGEKGCSGDVNFPPKLLFKNFKLLEAKLILIKEQISILECLEECKLLAAKITELLLLKNQTAMKVAETYSRGLRSLFSEVLYLKYSILKDYFSEDPKVVDASYKLKDHFQNKMENLQLKQIKLQKKIQDFKKLDGTKFERLVSEYQAICISINERKWTLENLMK